MIIDDSRINKVLERKEYLKIIKLLNNAFFGINKVENSKDDQAFFNKLEKMTNSNLTEYRSLEDNLLNEYFVKNTRAAKLNYDFCVECLKKEMGLNQGYYEYIQNKYADKLQGKEKEKYLFILFCNYFLQKWLCSNFEF